MVANTLLLFLVVLNFAFISGCAPLPNVSGIIDETTTAGPRPILSSKGLLSQKKSDVIMARLKKSVDPTDILERHVAVVESVTDNPLTKGNKVALLADGSDTYAAMFKEMQKAKDHINLETYIIEDDEIGHRFVDLLLQKQGEGVQVNLLYDSVGSMNTPDSFFQRLRDGGVQVAEFNPINPLKGGEKWALTLTHRDHRKILIIDGRVAIIGGINISKVYSSNPFKRQTNEQTPIHWRDTDLQIEGPAVAELQKLFLDSWVKQSESPLIARKYFPALKEEGNSLVRVVGSTPGETNRIPFIVYVSAFIFAQNSIYVTNSYFVPDAQIITALTAAAERGVDVKLILPGITDAKLALYAQRHHYSTLLKSGVQIYEHDTSLLHAKTAVVDRVWSTVGSTNMDHLSMLHNDEVNAFIVSREFAAEMEKMFVQDLADSRQILLEEWRKRPYLPRFRGWFVNLFSRWL